MKNKSYFVLFLVLAFSSAFMFCCSNKSDDHCPNPNVKVSLLYRDDYVPYQGNEKLKFLHNNSDTQIFIGQGKETYYVTEGISAQGECPKDYESVRVKFLNQTTNDLFTLAYERDKTSFPNIVDWNNYTFYKIAYKGKIFKNQIYNYNNDSIHINNVFYKHVLIIGFDTTSNYIAYRGGIGVLKIKMDSENWDLIP